MVEQGIFESIDDDNDGDDENDESDENDGDDEDIDDKDGKGARGDEEFEEDKDDEEDEDEEEEEEEEEEKGAEDADDKDAKETENDRHNKNSSSIGGNNKKSFQSSIAPRTPKNRTVSAKLPIRTATNPLEESSGSKLPDPASPDTMNWNPAKDEQVVNSAFLALVQALAIHYPLGLNDVTAMQSYWTEHRFAFQVKTLGGEKIYESRVDGYLSPYGAGPPQVIIEVKPGCRSFKSDEIRAQESGQMAAWIAEHPPTNNDEVGIYRRLLISQDHNEIYLNVAEFDWKYVEYIQGKRRPDASNCFLKMREYGPFRLNESGHMKWLGKILLGVTIAGGIMNSV